MKIKLDPKQIERLLEEPNAKVEISDPWWVIVLKVLFYLIGILLAGMGTATAATMVAPTQFMGLM